MALLEDSTKMILDHNQGSGFSIHCSKNMDFSPLKEKTVENHGFSFAGWQSSSVQETAWSSREQGWVMIRGRRCQVFVCMHMHVTGIQSENVAGAALAARD